MNEERHIEFVEELPAPAVLDTMEDMIRNSHRMVSFTGAGISTESGIPDYRGPNGVWQTGKIPHIDTVRTDEEARKEFWQRRLETYPTMLARVPNAGHDALARFEKAGKLLAVITQNIDGLHQKAGNQPERVIELHGSSHRLQCLNCGKTVDGVTIQTRLEAGERDPRCDVCGGPLRTSTILFGESLPVEALQLAHRVSLAADLMLVVGSSLVVNPAARLPQIARQQGAGLIIINRTPTPLDELADIRVAAEAGPTLSELARRVLGPVSASGTKQ
jgi:NAD-dependent deacetylase